MSATLLPMLAEIPTPSPAEIGIWLLVASFAVGAYMKFRGLEKSIRGDGEKREITPQPLRVQAETRMATHEELAQLRREFEDFRGEQRRNNHDAAAQAKQQTEEIFTRINKVNDNLTERITSVGLDMANAIGELRGELKRL